MSRKRLLWQLYPSYLLITLVSLLAVTWYASKSLRGFYLDQTAADLEAKAYLVEEHLAQYSSLDAPPIDTLVDTLGKKASMRVTIILPDGKVAGDSAEDPARMDNHANRPEIREALNGRTGVSTRYSKTLGKHMMYVAAPVLRDSRIVGVVRASIPLQRIDTILWTLYAEIGLGVLIIAVAAAAVNLLVSRRVSRPLEELRQGAKRFADGEFSRKLPVPDSRELAELAESLNQMAAQLDERIRTIVRHRNEQEAMLTSMLEGVLAVNTEGRIINMNQAAARLLGIDPENAKERAIQEVVRNSELQKLVKRALATQEPVECDMTLQKDQERFLRARGTTLRDVKGQCIGAVVVLGDVTNLRRLENVRRDFVANVSHELKTPITSIKGFVETLLDGAANDPEDAKRFLEIIARQADSLNSIIEDLLSLAKIEQEGEKQEIVLKEARIKEILQTAVQVCGGKASAKNIEIHLSCDDDITAKVNPPLLEQAVVNLIDNAIKYSDPGSKVEVDTVRRDSEILISVRDEGPGIAKEHLPRLFERFYRVDKARSRKMGGTGLGLAIVKHITQAHGGRVTVESAPGKGSVFQIHLPLT